MQGCTVFPRCRPLTFSVKEDFESLRELRMFLRCPGLICAMLAVFTVMNEEKNSSYYKTELSLLILLPLSYFVGVRTKKFGIYLDKTQIT